MGPPEPPVEKLQGLRALEAQMVIETLMTSSLLKLRSVTTSATASHNALPIYSSSNLYMQAARVCYRLEQKHERMMRAKETEVQNEMHKRVQLAAKEYRRKRAVDKLNDITYRRDVKCLASAFYKWKSHTLSRLTWRVASEQYATRCLSVKRDTRLMSQCFYRWKAKIPKEMGRCAGNANGDGDSASWMQIKRKLALQSVEAIVCKQRSVILMSAFKDWHNHILTMSRHGSFPTDLRNSAYNDVHSLQEALATEREAHAATIEQLRESLLSTKAVPDTMALEEENTLIRQECEKLRTQLTASIRQRSSLKQQIIKNKLQSRESVAFSQKG